LLRRVFAGSWSTPDFERARVVSPPSVSGALVLGECAVGGAEVAFEDFAAGVLR